MTQDKGQGAEIQNGQSVSSEPCEKAQIGGNISADRRQPRPLPTIDLAETSLCPPVATIFTEDRPRHRNI